MTKKIKVFITAVLVLGILGFCVMGCQSEKASEEELTQHRKRQSLS